MLYHQELMWADIPVSGECSGCISDHPPFEGDGHRAEVSQMSLLYGLFIKAKDHLWIRMAV